MPNNGPIWANSDRIWSGPKVGVFKGSKFWEGNGTPAIFLTEIQVQYYNLARYMFHMEYVYLYFTIKINYPLVNYHDNGKNQPFQ